METSIYPGEKTLAHSRNHVTYLCTEGGNLFKMAAQIKSERIWVQGLETKNQPHEIACDSHPHTDQLGLNNNSHVQIQIFWNVSTRDVVHWNSFVVDWI